jgi:hypothetical protein
MQSVISTGQQVTLTLSELQKPATGIWMWNLSAAQISSRHWRPDNRISRPLVISFPVFAYYRPDLLYTPFNYYYGTRGVAVGWSTALQVGRSRVRFPMVSLEFSFTQSFQPHYGHRDDSASNRNEYQEYFLRGKGGRCVGLTTLPPSCLEHGSLNLLEPSGPV